MSRYLERLLKIDSLLRSGIRQTQKSLAEGTEVSDRTVELLHSNIELLIIPKESDVGKTILALWQQHQNFGSMYQDDVVPESEIEF